MIVGREAELAAIEAFLGCRSGGARSVVLEGEPGLGKTTLWTEAVARARQRGACVLTARPAESEGVLPFSGLIDLLGPVFDETIGALPQPQRDALGAALLRRAADSRADELAQGLAARAMLAEATPPAGLVVAVDDVQWLDAPSARTLGFALRRLEAGVGVLLARRTAADAAAPRLEDALPRDRVERVSLGPLGVPELGRLLEARLGIRASLPALRRIAQWSNGNPYFALELARRPEDLDALAHGEAPTVPASLRDLLGARLEALPTELHPILLELAAAATLPRSLISEDDLAGAAGVVVRDGDEVRFAHPLLRALVYEGASPDRRRDVHRRLAERTADRDERALHLALATSGADEAAAAEIEAAAERATLRGAPDSGAGLLEHAVRITPADSALLAPRQLRAAELHFQAGAHDRARERAAALAAELPPGDARARALFLLGRLRSDDFAEMRRLFQAAIAEAEPAELRAGALIELAFAAINSTSFDEAREHAAEALRVAEHGDADALARPLALSLLCDFFTGRPIADDHLRRVLELATSEGELGPDSPTETVASILAYAGEFGRARPLLEQAYERASERGDEPARGVLLALAYVEWRAGDVERAAGHSAALDELASQLGHPQLSAYSDFVRASVLGLRGDVAAAHEAVDRAAAYARASGDRVMLVGAYDVRGLVALSLGDYAAAADHLVAAIELMRELGWREPGIHPTYQGAAEALIALGRTDEAIALVQELEELAMPVGRVVALAGAARCRGLAAAARGDAGAAIGAFERALEIQARLPEPLETGRTLLALGSLLRRTQQKTRAHGVLDRAEATFESLGAAGWIDRATAERGRIGGRPPRRRALTATEEQIAKLVVTGKTNHQIATALFISPKTVEWNLSKIYRKLAVASRTELAAKLTRTRG